MHTCDQAAFSQIPSHVRTCLEPLEQYVLQPCDLCKAGNWKRMSDLPALLSKLNGPSASASKGDGAAAPVAPVSSVSTAPVALSNKAAAPGVEATALVANALPAVAGIVKKRGQNKRARCRQEKNKTMSAYVWEIVQLSQ